MTTPTDQERPSNDIAELMSELDELCKDGPMERKDCVFCKIKTALQQQSEKIEEYKKLIFSAWKECERKDKQLTESQQELERVRDCLSDLLRFLCGEISGPHQLDGILKEAWAALGQPKGTE